MSAYIHKLAPEHIPWDFAVEFDYSEAMVEAIKRHIPSRRRKWVPALKQWWIQGGSTMVDVCALANQHCGGYVHVHAETPAPTGTSPVAAYTTLHLLPTAPPEVVKAVYKVLAKKVHPDAGGDTAKMQAINSAYALLKRDYA